MKTLPHEAPRTVDGSSGSMSLNLVSVNESQAYEDARCFIVFFKALAASRDLNMDGDLIDRFDKTVRPKSG